MCWPRFEYQGGAFFVPDAKLPALFTIGYDHSMETGTTVTRASAPKELASARRIRQQIFVDEQGIPHDVEEDGLNEAAIHVLLQVNGEDVGTARLVALSETEGEIARVALTREHRGKGLARLMLQELENIALDMGLNHLELHPHHYLEDFYAGLDYVLVPGSEVMAGEHRLITMEKKLPGN